LAEIGINTTFDTLAITFWLSGLWEFDEAADISGSRTRFSCSKALPSASCMTSLSSAEIFETYHYKMIKNILD
jgi:hypothetical protein